MEIKYELSEMFGTYKSQVTGEDSEWKENNSMVAVLLAKEVVWVREASATVNKDSPYEATYPNSTMVFVGANDVFAWGCADAEELPEDQIKDLFLEWHNHKEVGVMAWLCIKRQEKPQKPVEDMMRKAGRWDDVLEALPENHYEAHMRKRREEAAQKQS